MGGYGHLIVLILCTLSANSTKSSDPYQADQFQEPQYILHCERNSALQHIPVAANDVQKL